MTTLKILVFSDSHRSRSGIYNAIEKHTPDQVIHLGDLVEDAEDISFAFPQLPFCIVGGNCDGWCSYPTTRNVTFAGKQVLMSHGHLWGVKSGLEGALAQGRKAGCDLLLFGHTHVPYCKQTQDGMWVVNPGSARSTYALVTIEGESISCKIMKMT